MGYRDDLDAAQARAEALEVELADARAEIDALKGKKTALVRRATDALARPERSTGEKLLGAPAQLRANRELDGEIPESLYAELVDCIEELLGLSGTTNSFQGSLSWASTGYGSGSPRGVTVKITSRHGVTRIRCTEQIGHIRGGIFGGIGGGVGGGGMLLPIMAAWIHPALLAVTLPVWLGGVYASCRAIVRRVGEKRAIELEELADALTELCRERISAP